jgi:uncharacterized protein YkwD
MRPRRKGQQVGSGAVPPVRHGLADSGWTPRYRPADPPASPRPPLIRHRGRHRRVRRGARRVAIVMITLLAVAVPATAASAVRWLDLGPQQTAGTSAGPTGEPSRTGPAEPPASSAAPVPTATPFSPAPTPSRSPSPAVSPSASVSPSRSADNLATDYANQVVKLVNEQRVDAGCQPLRTDSRLAAAAAEHSEDMAVRDYFDHNTPDGVTPWTRIEDEGYDQPSAENIAAGQPTPDAVVTAWMNSPGHRANILNCDSHASGVGFYRGGSYGYYWTQDFGYE